MYRVVEMSPYVPPQLRFPNRLEKVRQAGVGIALSRGSFAPTPGGGCVLDAFLNHFWIRYLTTFHHPMSADWDNDRRGLLISSNDGICLRVYWTEHAVVSNQPEMKKPELEVEAFLAPSKDNWHWDQRLRRIWAKLKRAKLDAGFEELPITVRLRPRRIY
jgi:hypothetical protein